MGGGGEEQKEMPIMATLSFKYRSELLNIRHQKDRRQTQLQSRALEEENCLHKTIPE